jgi:5-formyltetrahydrofolate cyclo-ligase
MKRSIRKRMRELLAAMHHGKASFASQAACSTLTTLDEFRLADVVMIYLSLPEEVDTAAIAQLAWQAGKTVLAPKVNWQDNTMVAMEIHSLQDDLVVDDAGFRQPAAGRLWAGGDIDLIVIPGLAFDACGNRMGRGMGFYDRFLSAGDMRALKCGLAFQEQLLIDPLPTTQNDQPIDMLVTDNGVLRFNQK